VSEVATPEDAVERFKSAGFQHAKRFDVLAHDLQRLPEAKLPKGFRLEQLHDMNRFSKMVAHPYFGKVTTETRKWAVAAAGHLLQTRSDDFKSYLLSEGDLPVSIVTVLTTDEMAGIYDVGTIENYRGQGLAGYLLTYALLEARKSGRNVPD